jgi:hypothetical protein
MAAMAGMGRKTLSNVLVTAGLQFQDWTGAYRLFSRQRFDLNALFAHIVAQMHLELPPGMPFVAAIDDTKLPKSGKKVYGASYQRDPLGPKFHTNLVWAHRARQNLGCRAFTPIRAKDPAPHRHTTPGLPAAQKQ